MSPVALMPSVQPRRSIFYAIARRRGYRSNMSQGGDAMADVYAELAWAEKHLADLMSLARDNLRPGGGDDRPIGIEF